MKIINLYKEPNVSLIKKAQKQHPVAQKQLYELYAPKMLSICRQYIKDTDMAEEIMLNGFIKMFKYLDKYEFKGSFEGWIRKIVVRECITFLNKSTLFVSLEEEQLQIEDGDYEAEESSMDIEQIQKMIDDLPDGYRMVFNLYAIEGYKHQEIAETLSISVNTSKSQLHKARKMLQQQLIDYQKQETPIGNAK